MRKRINYKNRQGNSNSSKEEEEEQEEKDEKEKEEDEKDVKEEKEEKEEKDEKEEKEEEEDIQVTVCGLKSLLVLSCLVECLVFSSVHIVRANCAISSKLWLNEERESIPLPSTGHKHWQYHWPWCDTDSDVVRV